MMARGWRSMSGSARPPRARQLLPLRPAFLRSQQRLCPLRPGQPRVQPSSSQEHPQRLVREISVPGSCPSARGCQSWGSPGPTSMGCSAPEQPFLLLNPPAGWILIPKVIWALLSSWETFPDPAFLPATSNGFYHEKQLPDSLIKFLGKSLSSRAPLVLCPSSEPYREHPGAFYPDGEAWWSHGRTPGSKTPQQQEHPTQGP